FLADSPGIVKREEFIVDPQTELNRNWNTGWFCGTDGSRHDLCKQAGLQRQSRSAPFARNFANGAAEIHVDVVDSTFIDEAPHCSLYVVRIYTVKLQASRRFIGPKVCKFECLLDPVD